MLDKAQTTTTDTFTDFADGSDKIQIDTANGNETKVAALGLEVLDNNEHVNIFDATDDSVNYMTLNDVDHTLTTIADFEVI